ncbi:MAG: pyruvate kinase [Gammaproteobacteria bacterium]
MTSIRKTKIVATIGPACDSLETIMAMIHAGMSVARLNLSHGNFEDQKKRIQWIREAASELNTNVAVMIDTRGIEIRTGMFGDDSVVLGRHAKFTLTTRERVGAVDGVSITFKGLPKEVFPGAVILLDDGAIEMQVTSVDGEDIHCEVVHGGILGDSKSVNLPDIQLSLSAVGPENREDVIRELTFAADNDVDYIAASFVQTADDIIRMREILSSAGVEIPIIAKIENKAGVANLEEIIAVADGLMVARGDLGVELPLAEVPGTQKMMIRKTVTNGKAVITATQMLASMEWNPKPTRAEASDVANAILDGTSAVMLSGETAIGKYPVDSVKMMATLALRAESHLSEYGYLQKILPHPSNVVTEAVSQAAVAMSKQLNAVAIFSLTSTGFTSRLVSKHRPHCPILAITGARRVARWLSLNWGVLPILYPDERTDKSKIEYGIDRALELGYIKAGDIIVATAGQSQLAGGTDMIRVITVGENGSYT